ncbi:MAG: hypothetical protein JNJ61_25720 [Anaerolineae bacterium]|nr:hypothetical protein [Anaerolineae bacterium]
MTKKYTRCLVAVTMTVFDPGYVLDEEYLGFLEGDKSGWLFPPECKCIDDCLTPIEPRTVWIYEESGALIKSSRPQYVFSKWAVAFEYSHAFQGYAEGVPAMSPLEHECWNISTADVFAGWEDAISECADEMLIHRKPIRKSYSVTFLTVWGYRSWEYDGEWDSEWWLIGRLDLDTMILHQV